MTDDVPMHYLWIDFETDGTHGNDPALCGVLEVGWVLTDPDLDIIARGQRLYDPRYCRPGPLRDVYDVGSIARAVDLLRHDAPPYVRDMHVRSGLWDDLENHRTFLPHTIEGHVIDSVERGMGGVPLSRVTIAGSGVGHFDKVLMRRVMPALHRRVHYSALDTGSVRRFLRDVAQVVSDDDMPDMYGRPHRALDDCHTAIAQARMLRDVLRAWSPYDHRTSPTT